MEREGSVKEVQAIHERLLQEVGRVIVGKEGIITLLLVALLAEGHILIEGVPGVAKTLMARAFSRTLGLSFRRIQFTPDMLPSDVTGTFVFNPKSQDFIFREGPIFANVILADEINRATPKTQSALLEAMQERQVTVEGYTKRLQEPFMVLATQNPIELQGTYPLPEAQVDRFMFRLLLDIPAKEEEVEILRRTHKEVEVGELRRVLEPQEITRAQRIVKAVHVEEEILRYIVQIISSTRNDRLRVLLGGSPRASVQLLKASKALAAIKGREYVIPDDVKELAFSVLNHRIILNPQYATKGSGSIIELNYEKLRAVVMSALAAVEPPR